MKIILLIICITFLMSCSKEESIIEDKDKEKQALALAKQAEFLTATGKKIDALKLYDRIALEYPETETKKKIAKKMLKEGISIGVSLSSYTSQRMIALENRIKGYHTKHGRYPTNTEIVQPLDAWGNSIYFKVFTTKKNYDFIIYSNGIDKKKGTEDDILIVNQKNKNISTKQGNTRLSTNDIDQLNDLTESTDSSEITLSLDDINKAVEEKGDNGKSGEIELSLEELINKGL